MKVDPPYALLAELTHSCPLRCAYCSNPTELESISEELSTIEWQKVIEQAAELGVLQLHFSGGEPLIRQDLKELISTASDHGLYTNLITSGLGLTSQRAVELAKAGLNCVQVSVQDSDDLWMSTITAVKCLDAKRAACANAVAAKLPLTINIVLHRYNLERISDLIETSIKYGATRIELANVQFYGWAYRNIHLLMPSREQLESAFQEYMRCKGRYPAIEMIWVRSDYHEQFPKPCMGGWGRLQLTVTPNGLVLPCPAATVINTVAFDSVKVKPLDWIWYYSSAFNRFRGLDWLPEPCISCERQSIDFGGCRCQAFLLTGDASLTDPVCTFSNHHSKVEQAVELSGSTRSHDPQLVAENLVLRDHVFS